jgi:uncharacterized repeat protein (TIGR01451 family)
MTPTLESGIQEGLNLALTKASDCAPGTTTSFTLTVRNMGTVPADDEFVVTDALPAGLTIFSISAPGWDCSASTTTTLSCTYDGITTPLLPGDPPLVITIVVTVLPNASPIFANEASVAIPGDVFPGDDTDRIVCNNTPPAPAPAMSPLGMALGALVLLGVAFLAMRRTALAGVRR